MQYAALGFSKLSLKPLFHWSAKKKKKREKPMQIFATDFWQQWKKANTLVPPSFSYLSFRVLCCRTFLLCLFCMLKPLMRGLSYIRPVPVNKIQCFWSFWSFWMKGQSSYWVSLYKILRKWNPNKGLMQRTSVCSVCSGALTSSSTSHDEM